MPFFQYAIVVAAVSPQVFCITGIFGWYIYKLVKEFIKLNGTSSDMVGINWLASVQI